MFLILLSASRDVFDVFFILSICTRAYKVKELCCFGTADFGRFRGKDDPYRCKWLRCYPLMCPKGKWTAKRCPS